MRADAIIIGAETLRKDNPRLTLRDADVGSGKEQPWRVVLTRSGNLPQDAHLFTDEFKDRTLILRGLSLGEVLKELGRREILTVLIEGGGIVIGQAFQLQEVDEAHWYIAPRFSGGGRPSIAGLPLPASVELRDAKVLPIADNVCVTGSPVWQHEEPAAATHASAGPESVPAVTPPPLPAGTA
jgi:diaminohydroxyphosphoribosylaminopyrimidine deaminase/5-amino-6-(5-phosphoribosylamino)uracil reductase